MILFLSLIQIQDSVNIEMRDNAVAGSERFGYSIAGQMCSEDNWANNVAHGVLSGKRCENFLCCVTMTLRWYFESRVLLFLVNLHYQTRLEYCDVNRSHFSFY